MPLARMYLLVAQLSFLSFGGIYSFWALLARESVVECTVAHPPGDTFTVCRHDFDAVFTVSQVVPGPRANAASILGFSFRGFPGMAVFLLGMVTPSLVFTALMFTFYRKFRHNESLRLFFKGTGVAVLAILASFFLDTVAKPFAAGGVHAIAAALLLSALFVLAHFYRMHPLLAVAAGGACGFFFLQ